MHADRADLVRWWDALDAISGNGAQHEIEKGLQLARQSRHPDAQWLASLFPAGVPVSSRDLRLVMAAQGEDPRTAGRDVDEVLFSAEMGYAPAQYYWRRFTASDEERRLWREKAAAQGYRKALSGKAYAALEDHRDAEALKLFEQAAELGDGDAAWEYGKMAFGERDWQRYHWWCEAVVRGVRVFDFIAELCNKFRSSSWDGLSRILFTVAPVLKQHLDVVRPKIFGTFLVAEALGTLSLMIAVYDKCVLAHARRAINCWSMAGRRLGVAKDMRVKIARLLWEERWTWCTMAEEAQ